ncbi:unnamed protein product [Brachionus calyciflorus]|uniref:Uncharacterized protein n=1 Tax=Brachionus calyciflorus TaxID=104777 RepID=A0A813TSC5_9BILA|nr:unnamed protein product [Brachionus calyciflorus]
MDVNKDFIGEIYELTDMSSIDIGTSTLDACKITYNNIIEEIKLERENDIVGKEIGILLNEKKSVESIEKIKNLLSYSKNNQF